jgi:peptide/nickel transport system substrate-binding protein
MMQDTPGVFWNVLRKTNRFTAIPVPIAGLGIFAPINTQAWPTNDPAVRKAILYAVDRKGVIDLADAGAFAVNNTPLVKGMLGYDASLEDMYPYDPANAAATLQAAGWTKTGEFWEKDGKPLQLKLTAIASSTEYPLLAEAMQGYLRKAGMDAQVERLASPAWLAANIKGNMSMTPLQYIGVDPDALHLWYLPGQYFNWSHVDDPALGKLIAEGQQESDPDKRVAIYHQIQHIIMEGAMEMPLHDNVDLVMTTPKLTGVTWSGGGFEYLGAASMHQ